MLNTTLQVIPYNVAHVYRQGDAFRSAESVMINAGKNNPAPNGYDREKLRQYGTGWCDGCLIDVRSLILRRASCD
jgi:hypothetical protein